MIGLDQLQGTRCTSPYSGISGIGLNVDGMMHSTMEQIVMQNNFAWPMFVRRMDIPW